MSATGRNLLALFYLVNISLYILLWDAFTLLCSSCCVSYLFMECYFIHEVSCVTEKPDLSLIIKTSLCLLIKDRWVSHKGISQLSPYPQVESWQQDLASTNLPCLQYLKCPEKFIAVHFFYPLCIHIVWSVGVISGLILLHDKVRLWPTGPLMLLRAHNCSNLPGPHLCS